MLVGQRVVGMRLSGYGCCRQPSVQRHIRAPVSVDPFAFRTADRFTHRPDAPNLYPRAVDSHRGTPLRGRMGITHSPRSARPRNTAFLSVVEDRIRVGSKVYCSRRLERLPCASDISIGTTAHCGGRRSFAENPPISRPRLLAFPFGDRNTV
jgi:hypothetical protein